MYGERLARLQQELMARNLSALAVLPGTNLMYLTGLSFHLMERPTVLLVPAEGQPALVAPVLEKDKLNDPPFPMTVHTYSDGEGSDAAFMAAFDALPEVPELAVEYLVMRVLELRLVQRRVPNAIITDAGPVFDALRQVKTADEIEQMRQAINLTEDALREVVDQVRPGMTEREIAGMLTRALMERGGGPMPFEPIVLAGDRAALPHGTPSDRAVQEGDVLLIDFGSSVGGYVSDITRTFAVGKPLEGRSRAVYEAVKAANAAGRAAAKPGVAAQEVDRAARPIIADAGFGEYFVHRTGHGIGLSAHEAPYMVEGNDTVLEPGMAFTVEPGIYIPGEIGVRIEDDLIVTEDGVESLTRYGRDPVVIGNA